MCKPDFATNSILFGRAMVKGTSEQSMRWISDHCRGVKSFKEFLLSCHEMFQDPEGKWKHAARVGKGHIESLIRAGAFDRLDPDRERLMMLLPPLLELVKKYWDQDCKIRNGSKRLKKLPKHIKVIIDDYLIDECDIEHKGLERRLQEEKAVTGCYPSDSPFASYRKFIKQYECVSYEEIEENDYGGSGVFAGILRDFREIICKNGKSKGRAMAFLTFSAVGGDVEAVAFLAPWAQLEIYRVQTCK
jgi:DNA polymerase III alpha subunit